MLKQEIKRLNRQTARLNLYVSMSGHEIERVRDELDTIKQQLMRVYECLSEDDNSDVE